jgi:hypothetical protein
MSIDLPLPHVDEVYFRAFMTEACIGPALTGLYMTYKGSNEG